MVKFLKLFLPVLVIALGVLSWFWLTATKPETPSRPSVERVWTVETVQVTFEDVRPSLTLFGEVVAGREVALRAHVAGPVMAVSDRFVDGGAVVAGAVLVTIDPFDATQNVVEREASLAEARSRFQVSSRASSSVCFSSSSCFNSPARSNCLRAAA